MKAKRHFSLDQDVFREIAKRSRELKLSRSAFVNRILYRALIKSEQAKRPQEQPRRKL